MYTVYQVPTSHYYDVDSGHFTGGFCPSRQLIGNGCREDREKVGKNIAAYVPVAHFDVEGLEEVFEASNSPYNRESYEAKISRLKDMHSVSVGDLVRDSIGDYWLCAGTGWARIDHLLIKVA